MELAFLDSQKEPGPYPRNELAKINAGKISLISLILNLFKNFRKIELANLQTLCL